MVIDKVLACPLNGNIVGLLWLWVSVFMYEACAGVVWHVDFWQFVNICRYKCPKLKICIAHL